MTSPRTLVPPWLSVVLVVMAAGCNGRQQTVGVEGGNAESLARTSDTGRIPDVEGVAGTPVIIVYVTEGYSRDARPHVLFAAYPNGEIYWTQESSSNEIGFVVRGKAQDVEDCASDILRQDYFTTHPNVVHGIPDSEQVEIVVAHGGKRVRLASVHELFERSANVVVLSHGATAIPAGETRSSLLAKEPAEYREFRRVWDWCRARIARITPESGERFKVRATYE